MIRLIKGAKVSRKPMPRAKMDSNLMDLSFAEVCERAGRDVFYWYMEGHTNKESYSHYEKLASKTKRLSDRWFCLMELCHRLHEAYDGRIYVVS